MSRVPVPQGQAPALTDYLMSLPVVQLKTIERTRSTDLPFDVATDVDFPEGVSCVYARHEVDGPASCTAVAWERAEDQQGITVSALGGLTAGEFYTVVLRIEGSRTRPAPAQGFWDISGRVE